MLAAVVRVIALFAAVRSCAASCPHGCHCNRRAKDVDCHHAGYTDIPQGIPADTKTLSFAGNALGGISETCLANFSEVQALNLDGSNISYIGDGAFANLRGLSRLSISRNRLSVIDRFLQNLPSVRNISLAGNGIRSLNDQVFRGTWHVQHLDLRNNQFSFIPSDSLQNLTELKVLIFDQNHLSTVPSYAFQTLANLQTLDLRNNRIGQLFPNAFRGMYNLKVLMLDGNELGSLDSGVLGGLEKLSVLTLGGNQLDLLDIDAFTGAYMLSKIDFSNNRFDEVPTEALQSLLNLKVLSFSGNGLSARQPYPFLPLSSLEYLLLDDVSLEHLERSTLSGLVRLKGLSVRNNSLESLPADIFEGVPDLQVALLSGNPWACGCQLKGFLEVAKAKSWLVSGPGVLVLEEMVISVDRERPFCETPGEWRGVDLEDVPVDEILCPLGTDMSSTSDDWGISVDTLRSTATEFDGNKPGTTDRGRQSSEPTTENPETGTNPPHTTERSVTAEFQSTEVSSERSGTGEVFMTTEITDSETVEEDTTEPHYVTSESAAAVTTRPGDEPEVADSTEAVHTTKQHHTDTRVTTKAVVKEKTKLFTVVAEKAIAALATTRETDSGGGSADNDTYIPTIVSSIIAGALGVVLVGIMVYFVLGIGCRHRRHSPVYRIKSIDSISAGDRRGSGTEFLVLNTDTQDDEEVYDTHHVIPGDQESTTGDSSPTLPLGLQETRLISEFTPLTTLTETTVHFRRPSNDDDDDDDDVASLLGNS